MQSLHEKQYQSIGVHSKTHEKGYCKLKFLIKFKCIVLHSLTRFKFVSWHLQSGLDANQTDSQTVTNLCKRAERIAVYKILENLK